tara:strand:+ start:2469 stop:2756 length:288 start_codon:yes stop_codon:yes gene_type:complete
MSFTIWPVLGFFISIATLYAYIFVSPAYKKGERFSLPIIPFVALIFLHLFFAIEIFRYLALGVDLVMLIWAFVFRQMETSQRGNQPKGSDVKSKK